MTTNDILKQTLEKVNKNNAITLTFSPYQRVIIKKMMQEYAKICLNKNKKIKTIEDISDLKGE